MSDSNTEQETPPPVSSLRSKFEALATQQNESKRKPRRSERHNSRMHVMTPLCQAFSSIPFAAAFPA